MSVPPASGPPAIRLPAAFASSGYALRAASEADAAFQRVLFETARPDAALLAGWPEAMRKPFLDQQFHFQTVHYARMYPKAERLIVTADGGEIGRLILHRAAVPWQIVDIALLPSSRGRGLGAALLDAVLTAAAEARAGVVLQVEMGNPARRLYARAGFSVTATEPPYYAMRSAPAGLDPDPIGLNRIRV